jgi:putative PIG3 family NAD(P)H quinone oxidoreductase
MHCTEISQPGAPEVLTPGERETPVPAADEVLIKVDAAGVNRPDVMQRMGLYPAPPGASDLPGLEVAGTVVAVGEAVGRWQPGDAVCALTNGGGYAEYAVAPAGQCLPVPQGLTNVEAAALPETFFTVWTNVFDRGRLSPGETFLVHGGTSGIGVAAIQMAKAWGATVYATAGSDAKCQACLDLGADRAINYREQDFVEQLLAATNGAGVDVILDMVGGEYVARNLQLAALDGRIVNIAYQTGFEATVNFLPQLMKRLTLTASTLRPQSDAAKAAIADSLQQHIWPLIEAGDIRPVVDSSFPLDKASDAHTLMESSQHIGKILLTVNG